MSLFKTRTFWETSFEFDANFDQSSLTINRLNSESDFVIVGGHSGVLRIFKPSSDTNENTYTLSGYKATDLVLEKILQEGILQVGSGRLVSGSPKTHLVVLHTRSLGVYSLIIKEGATDHGTQNILHLHYEHKLRRSAVNLTIGPFGGSQNRDFLCVQSLDGMLTFYEQESFAFCCFLPDFLLPSPLVFVRKSDSFVVCNSNWSLTSFRYKLLSEIGQNSLENDVSGKKFPSDWSLSLGEAITDMEVIDEPGFQTSWIMVLGERNLFCISDGGRIKYMKKLEFCPICFTSYTLNDKIISLVVSETSTLMIYQNTSLKWSARLDILPIAIKRAVLLNIVGVLVLLSQDGNLSCCYLGTEPSLFVAPALNQQEIDFEKTGVELATLNKIIKNSYLNDIKVTNASAERELAINISVSPHLEPCTFGTDHIKPPSPSTPNIQSRMCTISVDLLPQAPFEEVQVSIFVQRPLKVVPAVEFFNNLNEKTSIKFWVFDKEYIAVHSAKALLIRWTSWALTIIKNIIEQKNFLELQFHSTDISATNVFVGETSAQPVPSLNVQVALSFISNLGVPRNVTKSCVLPINLVLETCPPLKEGEHKVTLGINQSPVGLSSLFPEFAGENSLTSTSNAMGLRNVNSASGEPGKIVTVLLAKSSERYRLQSDCLASLCLAIEQMIYRLRKYFSNKSDFSVAFSGGSSSLPVNGTLSYVRRHFESRQKFNALQDELTQLSVQFRLIQKRLIWKFKVKNPTPLSNLELLLKDTFTEIMKIHEQVEQETANLSKTQVELSCALHIIVNLVKIMDISESLKTMIESAFSPHVLDLDGQNWEDVMDASLCYLLRTVLAKSEKDKLRAAHTSFDEVKDTSKLEKHISQVLERIPKTGHLERNFDIEEEVALEDKDGPESPIAESVPIGSQLGESSLRALSARKSLLRKRHKT